MNAPKDYRLVETQNLSVGDWICRVAENTWYKVIDIYTDQEPGFIWLRVYPVGTMPERYRKDFMRNTYTETVKRMKS
jgi:hypothetical protein